MTYPLNYKTVLVLDHGSQLLQPSNEHIEFDVPSKAKASSSFTSSIPLKPLSKSLWTCSVEAALEFSRIVYDIFGKQKLISFISSDQASISTLTKWSQKYQDIEVIQRAIGQLGLPARKSKGSSEARLSRIEQGLSQAIDQLIQPTDKQKQARNILQENADRLENNGRVVCLTVSDINTYSLFSSLRK